MKQINIFSFLNDILYKKKGDLLKDPDTESVFVPYMMQRWLSMYSPKHAMLINNATNNRWQAYDSKEQWYKILLATIPKSKFKKLNYIKKKDKTKDKNVLEKNEYIKQVAMNKEISQREIKELIEMFSIDIDKKAKELKQNG